jgi:rare lipoprotein A (peptidoglycan hydrolase)
MRLVLFVCVSMVMFGSTEAVSATLATATWYSLPGRFMVNGQRFDPKDPTIAAGTGALYGKKLLVTNTKNRSSIVIWVTDRMANIYRGDRIDLTPAGARQLGFLKEGRIVVEIEVLPTS